MIWKTPTCGSSDKKFLSWHKVTKGWQNFHEISSMVVQHFSEDRGRLDEDSCRFAFSQQLFLLLCSIFQFWIFELCAPKSHDRRRLFHLRRRVVALQRPERPRRPCRDPGLRPRNRSALAQCMLPGISNEGKSGWRMAYSVWVRKMNSILHFG